MGRFGGAPRLVYPVVSSFRLLASLFTLLAGVGGGYGWLLRRGAVASKAPVHRFGGGLAGWWPFWWLDLANCGPGTRQSSCWLLAGCTPFCPGMGLEVLFVCGVMVRTPWGGPKCGEALVALTLG